MAKINAPKAFEKATLDPKVLSGIDEFVSYVNQNFDQYTRALLSQLTFGDNFKCQLRSVSAYHNQAIALEPSQPISSIQVLKVGSNDAVKEFYYTQTTGSAVSLRIMFANPIPVSTRSQITASGAFGLYEVTESARRVRAGDCVSIEGYSNKDNNLTRGLVLDIDLTQNQLHVYNQAGVVSETKTSFTGQTESPKDVLLLVQF